MPGITNGASDSYTPHANGDFHYTPSERVPNGLHASATMSNIRDTDIAIIGMACRLPGNVDSPTGLWRLLEEGRSGYCKVPSSRFNIEGWYHPDPSRSGSLNTEGGYFLNEDIRQFENGFFGINNREAASMDPQQRKLLEVTYECFESSGLTLEACAGANIGCYVGSFSLDYLAMQTRDTECLHRYSATGLGTTILSNRISHVFDLRGPSMVLDTACSSSLYSLHVACSALINGECDGAVVAAANLIQSPDQQLLLMKAGVLSPTSQCHTFDESADGYGRGEGVGALYLKKLSNALRDGDPVRAVVRGTAVNSNGKTNGISQPSAAAQEAVIRKAYAQAGDLNPCNTSFVECHGTGTQAGDPVELQALSKVFSPGRDRADPLLVGSVKTNIGHGEAVSGISAIIKVIMAFEKNSLAPSFGVERLNSKIPFDAMGIDVVRASGRNWPRVCKRAGVNSFGYGGANAHIILEDIESVIPGYHKEVDMRTRFLQTAPKRPFLIPISATSEPAMRARFDSIKSGDNHSMIDLAFTFGTKRSHLHTRGFLVARDMQELREQDLTWTDRRRSPKPLAFVFTGQGAQWPQMGKELMADFPLFLRTIRELDFVLQQTLHPPDWTLEDLILAPKETSKIHDVTRSQPVCTAVQIGLLRILERGSIRPKVVIGHSSGEIAAAYAANLMTAAEAIVVAYYRGYAISQCRRIGCMMAVGLGETDAASYINATHSQGSVVVACVNSPQSVTLSGDEDKIDELLAYCNAKGTFARKLMTGGKAYHSQHMVSIGKDLEGLLTQAVQRFSSPGNNEEVIMISSVNEKVLQGRPTPSYWRQNMESTVRFCQAMEHLISTDDYHFVEIGPHSALEQPIKAILKGSGNSDTQSVYHSAMIRGKDSSVCLLMLVGNLFLYGQTIRFEMINLTEDSKRPTKNIQGNLLTNLRPYPWSFGSKFVSESRTSQEIRNRKYANHDLLGTMLPGFDGIELVWRNILTTTSVPWLLDHKVGDSVVFPTGGYAAMAMEAISQVHSTKVVPGKDGFTLRNVSMQTPLIMPYTDEICEVFLKLRRERISAFSASERWYEFEITSYNKSISRIHCFGKICLQRQRGPARNPTRAIRTAAVTPKHPKAWYTALRHLGLNYGPSFTPLASIKTYEKDHASATVPVLQKLDSGRYPESRYFIHPTTFDAVIQLAMIAGSSHDLRQLGAKVPVYIEQCSITIPRVENVGEPAYVEAVSRSTCARSIESAMSIMTEDSNVILDISGVSLIDIKVKKAEDLGLMRQPCLRISCLPDFTRMNDASFGDFFGKFQASTIEECEAPSFRALCGALELLAHKNSRMRVLELGVGCTFKSRIFLQTLKSRCSVQMYKSYAIGEIKSDDTISYTVIKDPVEMKGSRSKKSPSEPLFDLILIPEKLIADRLLQEKLSLLQFNLLEGGALLFHSSQKTVQTLPSLEASMALSKTAPIYLFRPTSAVSKKKVSVVLIEQTAEPSPFGRAIMELTQTVWITLAAVTASTIPDGASVVVALELQNSFLSKMNEEEMIQLQIIVKRSSTIVWLTGANPIAGTRPELGLVSGLSRAIMLEHPALRFCTFAAGDVVSNLDVTAKHTLSLLVGNDTEAFPDDFEFYQHDGLLHVSRIVPDDCLNERFRNAMGRTAVNAPLKDSLPAQIKIGIDGGAIPTKFEQINPDSTPLPADYVEIDVKTVGIESEEIDTVAVRSNTLDASYLMEYGGVVRSIGTAITDLGPGDRVVVMAPGKLQTVERCPRWACVKLTARETFEVTASLPISFTTAIYTLEKKANLLKGQSVLIHLGCSDIGMAAIQIARAIGADIFTTVNTAEEGHCLESRFSISADRIFSLHESSFVQDIMVRTDRRGVDVILNSLTGEHLHDTWKLCAPFCTFVELGKRDIIDAGKLDMRHFKNSVTFTAFDLESLFYNPRFQSTWSELLHGVMERFREGKIVPMEQPRVIEASALAESLRLSAGKPLGKLILSLQDLDAPTQVIPAQHRTRLSSSKTYLLVGCLGGLGRSLSRYMLKQGARRFVFLGRSGCDKQDAQNLVTDMTAVGADVQVVRGDVMSPKHVRASIQACKTPIGGVVQAAMGLDDALFMNMTHEAWHNGIQPKFKGSYNLHDALEGNDAELDFFLMTSSVSGSIGFASEANYCASNSFLDAFARYRRSIGKPAIAVGLGMISEIGFMHEDPETEARLLRKGVQTLPENEFLQIIDIALSESKDPSVGQSSWDPLQSSHILTGLETFAVKDLRKQGFDVSPPAFADPRAALLAASLDEDQAEDSDIPLSSATVSSDSPAEVEQVVSKPRDPSAPSTVVDLARAKLSSLTLVPVKKIDPMAPLAEYGMDSMVATDFRTWFYQTFKVDVPYTELFASGMTLTKLVDAK